jgi:hypothetical protein
MPSVVNTFELELMQEKAATLGRLTGALEAALAEYRSAEAAAEALQRRQLLLDNAAEALWHFVVQREACGLRNTEAVLREYRVPAAIRARMGAMRRG